MRNKALIGMITLLLMSVPFFTGCIGQPPPPVETQAAQEEQIPPPDYSFVEKALGDKSPVVRRQAIANLAKMEHPDTINKLIKALADNAEDAESVVIAAEGLSKYGEDASEPVRELLWNSDNYNLQRAGFQVLAKTEDPTEFFKKVNEKYSNTPQIPSTYDFRLDMVRYMLKHVDRENDLPDVLNLITDKEIKISDAVAQTLGRWHDPNLLPLLTPMYEKHRTNDMVVIHILKIMSKYPPGTPTQPSPVNDITVPLNTFGSLNKVIQKLSYQVLKTYGYVDEGGEITDFIASFDVCPNENIRSNMYELLQVLPNNPKPAEPTYRLPAPGAREYFCK